ncbi:MAG: factor-independent urate hydroxylase [Streptomycetales bacterium]
MAITVGANQYGKAEIHLVRVTRRGERHDLADLTVSVALAGDLDAVHIEGDNTHVVATDTQKNVVFALAKEHPVRAVEDFALLLARFFVEEYTAITRARVHVVEQAWQRMAVRGAGHPHAFVQAPGERRTATVAYRQGAYRQGADGEQCCVLSGLAALTVLKSTGSEFHGYLKDRYTTLEETRDRILATEIDARWRHSGLDVDWSKSYERTRGALLEAFATTHSLSLQQTLYAMGEAALTTSPEVAEIRLRMPNKHHLEVDLSPFRLRNDGEVFYAADRPYGLIEGTVTRGATGAAAPGTGSGSGSGSGSASEAGAMAAWAWPWGG